VATNGEPRGAVGQKTYDDVQALVDSGMKKTEAFAKVAGYTGRSPGTVATAYYRVARVTPGSGVKTRPRKKASAASSNGRAARAAQTTKGLVADVERAVAALVKHTEQLERELAQAKSDAQAYRQIQKLMK
jgi:hypothetical protein